MKKGENRQNEDVRLNYVLLINKLCKNNVTQKKPVN